MTPEEISDAQIAWIEERLRLAEREMARMLAEDVFNVRGSLAAPPASPPPGWKMSLRRAGWRWYAAREWVAVHLLRVRVENDEEWT